MKISVVCATFNQAETLPLLIASCKNQDVHELIICDDGSTDREQIDLLNKEDGDFVRVFRTPKYEGMQLSKNINRGFRAASGDMIFAVMGDSYLQPNTIEILKRDYIEGSVGSGVRDNVDKDGEFLSGDWRVPEDRLDKTFNVEMRGNFWSALTGNSMIVPKWVFEKVGYWDETYKDYGKDDWDFFLRVGMAGIPLFQYNTVRINHVYHATKEESKENDDLFIKKVMSYGYKG